MQSRNIDLDNFLAQRPLNFLLFYGDYELINTIYLDDGSPLVDLSMELFNHSTNQTVKFEKPTNLSASEDNCHFIFRVEGKFTLEQAPEGWDVAVETRKSNTGNNFYFLKKEGYDLEPKPATGSPNKMVLVLKNFRADLEGGTRTIRATIIYGPLLKNNDNALFQNEFQQYYSYGNTIFITNNRGGKKSLPLQVGFTKGNAVLNDGSPGNTLELVIANKNWPASNLPLSTDSEFVISFEMSADINKEGAVATDTQIKGISITTSSDKWNVPSGKDRTEWPVTPKSGTNQLASDEVIKLNIATLVTNHSSGSGYLYVRYRNIPNYPDGQFVVTIEKTPLLYRGAQVGIGTISPSEKLEVAGNIKATCAIQPSAGNAENYGIMFPKDPGGGANDAAWIRYYARTGEDCTLEIGISNDANDHIALMPKGNVGIGTNEPTDKLHIDSGNLRIDSGLIKSLRTIAFYPNTDTSPGEDLIKVMKSDGQAVAMLVNHEGKLAISTTNPQIHLAIGDNDTGLNQEGDGKLAIYTDGQERVLINNNGNVGIGTTTPSEKLHVGGNAIVSGKLAIRTTTPTKIDLAIGDNDTGLKQEADGKLAIYTDGQERVLINNNGNVGIGTTTPSAKLEVNGSVKLGNGSTAWNRIIAGKVIINYANPSQSKVYGKGIRCIRYNTAPLDPIINLVPNNPIYTEYRGRFDIIFDNVVDSNKLVVIVTPQDLNKDNIVNVHEVKNNGFTVQVKDSSSRAGESSSFHFIALELTENSNTNIETRELPTN